MKQVESSEVVAFPGLVIEVTAVKNIEILASAVVFLVLVNRSPVIARSFCGKIDGSVVSVGLLRREVIFTAPVFIIHNLFTVFYACILFLG